MLLGRIWRRGGNAGTVGCWPENVTGHRCARAARGQETGPGAGTPIIVHDANAVAVACGRGATRPTTGSGEDNSRDDEWPPVRGVVRMRRLPG